MITRALTLLFALTTGIAAQQSSQQPQNQAEHARQQTEFRASQQAPQETPTPIPDQPPTAGDQQPTSQRDQEIAVQRENPELTRSLVQYTKDLAGYTLALAVVGGLVGVLTIGLLFFQALYTGRAANAAQKSAEIAERTMILTQRAYIVVQRWEVRTWQIGLRPLIVGYLLNNGPTTARNLRVEANVHIRHEPLPNIPEWPGYDESGPEQAINPSGIRTSAHEGDTILTAELLEQLNTGIQTLYVWGRVRYHDVFTPRTDVHYTTFAFRLEPMTRAAIADAPPSYYYAT